MGVGGRGGGQALVFNGRMGGGSERVWVAGCAARRGRARARVGVEWEIPGARRMGLVVVSSFGSRLTIPSEPEEGSGTARMDAGCTWAWDREDWATLTWASPNRTVLRVRGPAELVHFLFLLKKLNLFSISQKN